MYTKGNTRSTEPSSPSSKSKSSPKSSTGKQRRKFVRPKPSWVQQSLSHNSVTRIQSPYLSRHDFDLPVASKYTEPSKSPKIAKKTDRKSHKKRKIWTLPPTTFLPPASLNRHEGSEQCDTSKTQYRKLRTTIGDRTSDSERDKMFGIDSRMERDKRYNVSEYKNEEQKANETKELMQLLAESNPRQNPAYIISGTLTPERQLSSNDVLKLFGELTNRQITEGHDSVESIMYDRKYTKPRHKHGKHRSNGRVSTTLSRRTEQITYNLSSYLYKKNGMKNYILSNTSSERLSYVPAVEMYEHPFGVVVKSKKDYIDRNFEKGTVVCNYNGKHKNSFEDSNNILRNNSFMKETTSQANNKKCPPSARTGIQNDNGIPNKARTALNAISKLVKLTRNEDNTSKNRPIPAQPRFQKKSATHKFTLADIKKKLALLKFPITVTDKNQCAPIKVKEYVAPQYEEMPKIWQYMKGWSTDYNEDNMVPNKYLKLLQRQKSARKPRKGNMEIIHEKTPRNSPRSGQRKLNFSANREPKRGNVEDNDLKIIFQSRQNGTFDTPNKLLSNSSPPVEEPDQRFSRSICEKELFSEEKNILDVFMENLKYYNDTGNPKCISHKRITKPMKCNNLNNSQEIVQDKIDSTLKKLECNYFYDYNNWIENSPKMSKKSSLVKRKKTFCTPESFDIKVTSWKNIENMENAINPEFSKKILNSTPAKTITELIQNDLKFIRFDNNTDNLRNNEKVEKVYKTNGSCRPESPFTKAFSQNETEHFTKSMKKYDTPTKITKAFVKPSRRIIHKHFKDHKSDLRTAVQLEDESVSLPKLSQSINNIKAVITIPGFSESANKITVKSLNENEITIEDSCKKILMRFETTAKTREEFILLHEPPKFIDDNYSVSLLNEGQTKFYRSKYQLCTVRLPEQICSLWPLFIKKLESGSSDIKIEFPIHSTGETEANILTVGNITKGRLHCHLETILMSQNRRTTLTNLDRYHSDIDQLLYKVNAISFLEDYTPIERHLIVKMRAPVLEKCQKADTSLIINFNLLTENHIAFRFGQYYINDEFSNLDYMHSRYRVKAKNSLIRLHQDNMALLTFSISIKVIQNVIQVICSGYVEIIFTMNLNSQMRNAQKMENIEDMKRPQVLRKCTSVTSVKNEVFMKINRWKNKSTSDMCEVYKRKSKPGKIKFTKEDKARTAKFKVDNINGIRDFMKIIGCAGGDTSPNTINGQLSERILEHLHEFTIWSEDISQGQALLILLLSTKSETKSFEKFRSALVHGIATKRISSSTELDQEYLAVEQDADMDYKGDDGKIVEELYTIARKAASESNHPISAKRLENAINCLVNRKRKLNISYLRVMAKYVGLGLISADK